MPTRSIQELSEERGAARLRAFGLEELGSATNGFSRSLKVGEGGFGSVYRAFFRSAAGWEPVFCSPWPAAPIGRKVSARVRFWRGGELG
jgi:hypothetical protein